jgi:DNA (cytosine-5)-methyltransferase 1
MPLVAFFTQGIAVPRKSRSAQQTSVISFFSGCGGLDLGFQGGFDYRGTHYPALPFRISSAYDFNAPAVETYRRNLGEHVSLADLGQADVKDMPSADVLLGGFPCQEFSVCGPRKGLESERGQLYKAMVRYAKHHRPKLVIAENVANLLFINDGWDFSVIKKTFSRAGYRCVAWRVNAADFGVPQSRQRVIVVFVRKDLAADPIEPVATHSKARRTSEWAIDDLKQVDDESIPNQSQYFKAAVAGKGHGQGDEITRRDAPGYTVRANAKSRIQFHYELPRRLTVRECARLQTFPDSFIFPRSATEAVRQIGNAVPPVLAHAVAESIASFLEGLNSDSAKEGT